MTNAPAVDLTNTKYDPLETDLSQRLGLKVFMVHGWSSAAFDSAASRLDFARTPEAFAEAKEHYSKVKTAMIASLRDNIAARDPALGAELSDNELFALQQTGHLTARKSNADPEHAVIIFDPASAPARPVFSIGIPNEDPGKQSEIFNFVAQSPMDPALSREAAINWAFGKEFTNAWTFYKDDDSSRWINVKNLVENFDIDPADIRRYEALKNVRHALQNQQEFIRDIRWQRDLPAFSQFAELETFSENGLSTRDADLPYSAVEDREESMTERDWGFKDKNFFEKLKLAGAVMNLTALSTPPKDTFARLSYRNKVDINDHPYIDNEKIQKIMDELNKGMEKHHLSFRDSRDLRTLFPIFREYYEADKSTGVKREYLDTIMAGLQRYFPTLTNGPVPDPKRDKEPPRTLAEMSAAPKASAPKKSAAAKPAAPKKAPVRKAAP